MKRHTVLLAVAGLFLAAELGAQPSLMENLGRGTVAVRTSATEVFVGWRVLGTDDPDVAFNLYRSTSGGPPVRLNATPLGGPSHLVDAAADLAQPNAYFVRPIVFGLEQPPGAAFTLPAGAPVQQYLRVPLQVPAGGTTPAGEAYTCSPNDTSVGDLDGDGDYELVVKWDPSNWPHGLRERAHPGRHQRDRRAARQARRRLPDRPALRAVGDPPTTVGSGGPGPPTGRPRAGRASPGRSGRTIPAYSRP